MRKFFASAFGLSATIALVAGIAFAWTGTASAPAAPSYIGSLSVSLAIQSYTGSPLLPNLNVKTASGAVNNNTGVPIALVQAGSDVSLINVPGNTGCNPYVDGSVVVTNTGPVPTASTGGAWDSYLILAADTPNPCQGLGVDYTINVNVTT